MLANIDTIDIVGGLAVHAVGVQQYRLPGEVSRECELAAVEGVVIMLGDAGERGLHGEGDQDALASHLAKRRLCVGVGREELVAAVQVDPAVVAARLQGTKHPG